MRFFYFRYTYHVGSKMNYFSNEYIEDEFYSHKFEKDSEVSDQQLDTVAVQTITLDGAAPVNGISGLSSKVTTRKRRDSWHLNIYAQKRYTIMKKALR